MFDESGWNKEFKERFNHRYDELKWLYFSLYGEDYQALDWLTAAMWDYYSERKSSLKKLDRQRECTRICSAATCRASAADWTISRTAA